MKRREENPALYETLGVEPPPPFSRISQLIYFNTIKQKNMLASFGVVHPRGSSPMWLNKYTQTCSYILRGLGEKGGLDLIRLTRSRLTLLTSESTSTLIQSQGLGAMISQQALRAAWATWQHERKEARREDAKSHSDKAIFKWKRRKRIWAGSRIDPNRHLIIIRSSLSHRANTYIQRCSDFHCFKGLILVYQENV